MVGIGGCGREVLSVGLTGRSEAQWLSSSPWWVEKRIVLMVGLKHSRLVQAHGGLKSVLY